MKKSLPLAISSFEKIRSADYIYVDKTQQAYNLINKQTGYSYVFLSRPRRFGKSLFVDTLKQIFLGNKDLFKDLWIYNSNWKWDTHPIIQIDFSDIEKFSVDSLQKDLTKKLDTISEFYGVEELSSYPTLSSKFSALIKELAKINKVVILIDEYDKPILDNLDDIKVAESLRNILKSFYEVIKANDPSIRFLFMTGVTKFSQMSVFSGLNNLKDISFDDRYADITGYNQNELEFYFQDYINYSAQKLKLPPQLLLKKIKTWYNGYRFSDSEVTVYNPFSILNFLDENKFSNYWFATGTPTFLIKLLKKQYPYLLNLKTSIYSIDVLKGFDLEHLPLITLLYQSGYLTILDYLPETQTYKLGYPNFEVDASFNKVIAESLSNQSALDIDSTASVIYQSLQSANLSEFIKNLQIFISKIPSQLISDKENYYNTVFHCVLNLATNMVHSQINHFKRRPDTVVTIGDKTYIFELKLNKTAQEALDQINHKKYYEPFLNDSAEIYLVGVNFDTKNIIEVTYESSKLK